MQSEDESELSELASSSDQNVNSKNAKKVKRTKPAGYKLHDVLKPGRTTHYTAKALYDQIMGGDIDLDPEYQRGIVWSDMKQVGLIDSIFRNFYVPPIIFAVAAEDDGTEKRVCIDGKQRLTSIQKFIGGLIPHRDPYTNEKLWFCKSNTGPERKLLPPQYRTLFQNKQLVCVEYNDLPPQLEREVFQRVQMGMALTQAEKLQVITGPWPDFVREITQKYYTGKNGINGNMDLDQTRAREFQNISHTLFCIDHLPTHIQGTAMQVEKWLAGEDGPSTATRATIHETFKIFKDLANHEELKAPFKKPTRVAPVEFIMSGVLIEMLKGTHSLPQLSRAIGILRTETRAEHEEVRTNSKILKTMFDIIAQNMDTINNADMESPTLSKAVTVVVTKSNLNKRRRREKAVEDTSRSSEEDEDYKPEYSYRKLRGLPSRGNVRSKSPVAAPQVKREEIKSKISDAGSTRSTNGVVPPRTSGLEQIRATKLQIANLLGETHHRNAPPLHPAASTSSTIFSHQQLPPLLPTNFGARALETFMIPRGLQHGTLPSPTNPNYTGTSTFGYPNDEDTSASSRMRSQRGMYRYASPDAAESVHDSKRRKSSQSPRDFRKSNTHRSEDGPREREYPFSSFAHRSGLDRDSVDTGQQRDKDRGAPGPFKRDTGWPRSKVQDKSEYFRRGSENGDR